ncbi:hypothetical protein [Bacillus cereus]|uniref:hypothetical protein n=1 Tax=Bacillus cereus TaxID=1396 RepID=UPI0009950517|nr:hypothetical protein [Bacillus cereus]OPA11691.1 hypothetical protein BHL54_19660 [Bacillus cereus]
MKMKQIKKMVPIAVLSTTVLLSPASSFAATNVKEDAGVQNHLEISQNQVIQGYIMKNGIKTPIYKGGSQLEEAPYPELSSNPNDPVPEKGYISSENSVTGSTLYFSKIMFPTGLNIGITGIQEENMYVEKKADDAIEYGTYNPQTLVRMPANSLLASEPNAVLQHIYEQLKTLFDGTTVKRETAFEKIGSGVVPKNGTYTFSQAVTSGLSTSDALGGSLTMGMKMTFKEGGGVLPIEAAQEFSSQLTASYNHTITVTSQKTNTQTLSTPKASEAYQYDKYVGAVYQLSSTYTVEPGPGLSTLLADHNTVLAQNVFKYDDSTLYLAVTPGAGS